MSHRRQIVFLRRTRRTQFRPYEPEPRCGGRLRAVPTDHTVGTARSRPRSLNPVIMNAAAAALSGECPQKKASRNDRPDWRPLRDNKTYQCGIVKASQYRHASIDLNFVPSQLYPPGNITYKLCASHPALYPHASQYFL